MSSTTERVSIPKTMKAAIIERFGEPDEVMRTATVPVPDVDDRDVLIDVRTAGVGSWDPDLCRGEFGAEAGLPRVLGSDGAGIIVAVGSKVKRFHVGDRVYGFGFMNPKGGFYAEYAAVSEDEVAPLPDTLSFDEAGTLAVDGLTALAGLDALELRRDQRLMIFGASGGVGHLAIEIAKRMGVSVLAIASGSDGVALARRLGADEAIEGHDEAIEEKARAFAPDGLDAALVLAPGSDEVLKVIKRGGKVAHPNGVEPAPRRAGLEVRAYDGYHGRAALDRLNELVAEGPLSVEVTKMYPLEQTPKALADVARHHLGKLAIRVRGD